MSNPTIASGRMLHSKAPFLTYLDPAIIFDAQARHGTAANAAAIRSHGYSHAEFIGLTPDEPSIPDVAKTTGRMA